MWFKRFACVLSLLPVACGKPSVPAPSPPPPPRNPSLVDALPVVRPARPWDQGVPLTTGETFAFHPDGARREAVETACAAGLLDVDLSDTWAPFLFQDTGGSSKDSKPNRYRETFVSLAADQKSPEEIFMESPQGVFAALAAAGIAPAKGIEETPDGKRAVAEARRAVRNQRDRNFLEVHGIPPTLTVLLARVDEDLVKGCLATWDREGLAVFNGNVTFQSREQARRDYSEAISDANFVEKLLAGDRAAADATLGEPVGKTRSREELLVGVAKDDPKAATRIERYRKGQARLRAIRAVQARLICEELLTPRTKYVHGIFDLATNQALAAWERKNNIFGWGFLGGETLAALLRPPMDLHLDTFRRIVLERIVDAAGILEDGSVSQGKNNPTYTDRDGVAHPVPNLIDDFTQAFLDIVGIHNTDDLVFFLRSHGAPGLSTLHIAYVSPPLPPYYRGKMQLKAEIDRGDVFYDLPFDEKGKPVNQARVNYPSLTLFVDWEKQSIPIVRWRTTIGSWRSEVHANGKVYFKYKSSDVGPRIWKDIVAGPVWIPPDGTPAQDLLTRKTLDRDVGPVVMPNTDVMGPGFQSAYGLVMAIHHRRGGQGDNQIRTHGSVDYTSIARRYSHGCHRLVNNRAVRLFDFILRHREFTRVGQMPINLTKHLTLDGKEYAYQLNTRGYYYELRSPIPVMVTEGRIMGKTKRPIDAFIEKPGVDYSDGLEPSP